MASTPLDGGDAAQPDDTAAPPPPAAGDVDLDALVAMLKDRLRRSAQIPGLGGRGLLLVAVLAAVAWLATGIYKVQPDEQGVVLRLGRWVETSESGLHYHLPFPIDTVMFPKVTQVNQLELGKGETTALPGSRNQMLTGDENIVQADCAVTWKIKDAGQYLFKVDSPEGMLKIAAESALREVIGRNPIQAALSDRRQQIADDVKDLLQRLLDGEQAGILIIQVQLQRADPPLAVIDAFNDVQRARADQERARNEAEAFHNDILPRARGEAQHIVQEADAYRTQVINLAQGEAKSFLSVYQSYAQNRDVTAWRLYLESIDELLRKSGKVIIDASGKGVSSVVPYLPMGDGKDKPAAAQGAKK